ncbi:MAG TPA: TIGR00730 family Rossman fold protein [Bacillales bacterium]|nr:TIGR00730 family Rossman fold protein [Bacillales bacterium]
MKRVCVFAGSNSGTDSAYAEAAVQLGMEMAEQGIELVYGGSKIGLMGHVANTVLANNGCAIGVMPTGLFHGEMVHDKLTELYEVADIHERKAKMSELADAFIALPGGYGTLEEVFEVVSWGQLGIHQKPVGLLNLKNYYQPLIEMVHNGVKGGFIPKGHMKLLTIHTNPAALLDQLRNYHPPENVNKWSDLPDPKDH